MNIQEEDRMNIVRRQRNSWNPASELARVQREFDRLFDAPTRRFFADPWGYGFLDRKGSPAMDVVENEDGFLVSVDLPGVEKSDLEISVADNVLTVKGQKNVAKRAQNEENDRRLYRKESWEGSFKRSLQLSAAVDAQNIDAKMADGVLHISIPKREEAKPREIEISVN